MHNFSGERRERKSGVAERKRGKEEEKREKRRKVGGREREKKIQIDRQIINEKR